jgi:hypothetical protein
MKMKKYLTPSILIILSIGCLIAYNLIGSSIDANWILIEPFWLIPTWYLLLFIGVIWAIIILTKQLFKNKKWK